MNFLKVTSMKHVVAAAFAASVMSLGVPGYAADGDLIVDGKLGVGTVSPVNNTLQIGPVGSSGYSGNQLAIGNGNQVMSFFTNPTAGTWYSNTNFALLPAGTGSTGNVGIGTVKPSSKLAIFGGDLIVDSGFGRFKGWSNGNLSGPGAELGYSGGFAYLGSYDRTASAYQPLRIYASAVSIGHNEHYSDFTVSSSGNVGIGSTNPVNTLQIGDVGGYSGNQVAIGNGNQAMSFYLNPSAATWYTSSNFALMASGSGATGNVGIGTTDPTSLLAGTSGLVINHANWAGLGLTNSNNRWLFYTRGDDLRLWDPVDSDWLVFQKGGRVGIRTTDPQGYNLYVAGTAYSTGGWQGSDIRFKEDLQPIDTPLKKVLNLEGVSYKWKTQEYQDKGFPEGRHYGVIAQEIETVLPEVVNTSSDGTKAVAYTEIIPVLIEAIKEQQKIIESYQNRVETLEILVTGNKGAAQ